MKLSKTTARETRQETEASQEQERPVPGDRFVTILNSGADGTALAGACTAGTGGVGVHGVTSGTGGVGVLAESNGAGMAFEARGQAHFTGKIGVGTVGPIGHLEVVANGSLNNQFLRRPLPARPGSGSSILVGTASSSTITRTRPRFPWRVR